MALDYKTAHHNLYGAALKARKDHYPVAHYLLGLSVECALRTILEKYKNNIDKQHRLDAQYREALVYTSGGNKLLNDAAKDITLLVGIWHNEDRYESVQSLYAKRFRNKTLLRALNVSDQESKNPQAVCDRVKEKMMDIVLTIRKAARI